MGRKMTNLTTNRVGKMTKIEQKTVRKMTLQSFICLNMNNLFYRKKYITDFT